MRGGARKGAGRKLGAATVPMNFLIDRAIVNRLRAEVGPGKMSAFVQRAIERTLDECKLVKL
jgi:hypothetical protein